MAFLRQSVKISSEENFVNIQRAFWETSLPKDWVDAHPQMWDIFRGGRSYQEITDTSQEFANVLTLLRLQNCFYEVNRKDSYSLREVRTLFESISDEWYQRYYSHPLWQLLRDGTLSTNGFIAWVVQNYHISRAAGVTDARCATRFKHNELLQTMFQTSSLEEYWHCDAFYFVSHKKFPVTDSQVKQYVPLPSTLAFEQQMLRMADEDWLGYALVSYFQESSIKFYEDCKEFYQTVEKNYDIEGFFKPWLQHIELDFNHKHAESFADLFDSKETFSSAEVMNSIRNAWFAFAFLFESLDEILGQNRENENVVLRNPIFDGQINSGKSSLLSGYSDAETTAICSENAFELYEKLYANRLTLLDDLKNKKFDFSSIKVDYVHGKTVEVIFKALSYAKEHDEIITLGKLAENAFGLDKNRQRQQSEVRQECSAQSVAVANFLTELALQSVNFCFICYHFYNLSKGEFSVLSNGKSTLIPIDKESFETLKNFLKNVRLEVRLNDRLINTLLQFNELLVNWLSTEEKFFQEDLFPVETDNK